MAEIAWNALSQVIDVFSLEEYTPVLHQFLPWGVDQLDERVCSCQAEPAGYLSLEPDLPQHQACFDRG